MTSYILTDIVAHKEHESSRRHSSYDHVLFFGKLLAFYPYGGDSLRDKVTHRLTRANRHCGFLQFLRLFRLTIISIWERDQ